MFENSGTKIKNFAFWVFVIDAVVFVILGIAMLEENTLLALILIVAGVCVSYVSALFLIAFGDMVETNAQLVKINEQILKQLEKSEKSIGTNSTTVPAKEHKSKNMESTQASAKVSNFVASKKDVQETPLPEKKQSEPVKVDRSSTMMSCPQCGKNQRSNRTCCFNCGIVFEVE